MKANWKTIKWALLTFLILISCFYRLADYPRMWYDEGFFSMVAANLANYGHYATTVITGVAFHDFDPGITTGPTVILPVALMYRMFGVSIMSGRIIAALYLAGFLLMFYFLSEKIFGEGTAMLAFVSLFFTRFVLIMVKWGRFTMGEVPAIFFLLCGIYLHDEAEKKNDLHLYAWAGLLYGLSILTKEYVALFLIPTLLIFALLDGKRKKGTSVSIVVAFLPLLMFYFMKALLLGGNAAVHNTVQKSSFVEEFFSPGWTPLISLFTAYITVPLTIAWALLRKLKGIKSFRSEQLILAIIIVDIILFLPSAYIARLALFLVLSNILLANYLADVPWIKKKVAAIFCCLALLAALMTGGFIYKSSMNNSENDHDLSLIESYIKDNVPKEKLIETPEYEVAAFSAYNKFHIPPGMTPTSDQKKLKEFKAYDFIQIGAPYYLEGDFARGLFNIRYTREKVNKYYNFVHRIGRYVLYKKKGA